MVWRFKRALARRLCALHNAGVYSTPCYKSWQKKEALSHTITHHHTPALCTGWTTVCKLVDILVYPSSNRYGMSSSATRVSIDFCVWLLYWYPFKKEKRTKTAPKYRPPKTRTFETKSAPTWRKNDPTQTAQHKRLLPQYAERSKKNGEKGSIEWG
jgi:hypothetical protein